AWIALESEARGWLDSEQVPRDRQRFERGADLRYEHQSFELTCPLGDGPLTPARLEGLIQTFHAEHRRLYSSDLPRAQVELVTLRVTAIGVLPKRTMPSAGIPTSTDPRIAAVGERTVYFRGGGATSVRVYARDRLASGMTFAGPAIVDQDDATCLIAPGFR